MDIVIGIGIDVEIDIGIVSGNFRKEGTATRGTCFPGSNIIVTGWYVSRIQQRSNAYSETHGRYPKSTSGVSKVLRGIAAPTNTSY